MKFYMYEELLGL